MNLLETMQNLSNTSMKLLTDAMESNRQLSQSWMNAWSQSTTPEPHKRSVPCCPPDIECPPHCLTVIQRQVMRGECIVVPVAVKIKCNTPKTYKVGVRPLLDPDGHPAPVQPTLDKTSVTVQPGHAVVVRLFLDLKEGFKTGTCYQTEIVLREKQVNQNICLRICVDDYQHIPEVTLKEEAEYYNHFQSWESHYYCEKKPRRTNISGLITEKKKS
jgi:hypothetical protein